MIIVIIIIIIIIYIVILYNLATIFELSRKIFIF